MTYSLLLLHGAPILGSRHFLSIYFCMLECCLQGTSPDPLFSVKHFTVNIYFFSPIVPYCLWVPFSWHFPYSAIRYRYLCASLILLVVGEPWAQRPCLTAHLSLSSCSQCDVSYRGAAQNHPDECCRKWNMKDPSQF